MSVSTVSTSAELNQAIAAAQGGDTILLAPGEYAGVRVNGLKFDTAVTIRSADPNNEAVLKEFEVYSSKGVQFSGLEFSSVNATEYYAFRVTKSESVVFTDINIHGSLDNNPANDRSGFLISNSTNVTIENSVFRQLGNGIVHQDNVGLTFSGNTFTQLRTDGIHGGGAQQITIARNTFTDFSPADGDHPDAIQFFTRGMTTSSRDIMISDNVVTRGDGKIVEGIFFMDETGVMPFKNVTIVRNLVAGGMYDGITVLNVDGFTVTGNTVLAYPDQGSRLSIFSSSNGVSSGNTATTFLYDKTSNVVLSNNTVAGVIDASAVAALKAWFAAHPGDVNLPLESLLKYFGASAAGASTMKLGSDAGETLRASVGQAWIEGGAGGDRIEGGDATDFLRGDAGDDYMLGAGGNDDMHGNAGNDSLEGGAGDDWVVGGKDNDLLSGSVGNDIVYGNLGDDTAYGDDGVDWVRGGQGNDILWGGAGDDFMSGDRGADTLTGGSGADQFNFGATYGVDRILDFSAAAGDRVHLETNVAYTVSQIGVDTVIDLGGGDQMVLVGVQAATLPTGWLVIG